MNKAQLIDAIAEKSGITKADAKKALDPVLLLIFLQKRLLSLNPVQN